MSNDIHSILSQYHLELMEKHANVALAKSVGKYVEDAEKLKKEYDGSLFRINDLKKDIEDKKKHIKELEDEKTKLLHQLDNQEDLKKREEALMQNEMQLELTKIKYELQCEQKSKDDLFKLVDTVFRNRSYTHATSEHTNVPMTVPVGCYATTQPVNNSKPQH